MSPLHQRFSATRSRMFRRSEEPHTPEPMAQDSNTDQPPSPPRHRFRLRKRNAPQLTTTVTQQFLASVAVADVPIPSIEEPEPFTLHENMFGTPSSLSPALDESNAMDISYNSCGPVKAFSPPKTPAPELNPSISASRQFPDWSLESSLSGIDSSPEYESSRPSTARSSLTSGSLFSGASLSFDDMSDCTSPMSEKQSIYGDFLSVEDANKTIRAPAPPVKQRKAPWTKAMSQHLWSTYLMYLQDPKVTPIRFGKSRIPPHGVLLRVSREARRSWKGSSSQAKPLNGRGSMTPTTDIGVYAQWPHTDAATRAQLRDLCRANAGTNTRNYRYSASSPTPYGRSASRRSQRSTPARSPSIFSSSDMAMSLALSTSDSMQPQAPLAQLTSSQLPLPVDQDLPILPTEDTSNVTPSAELSIDAPRPRLGSPFAAKSYGPSSSSSLAECLHDERESQRQSHTIGARRSLRSPARVTRSRSNTLKRGPVQAELELRRSKRPSLPTDMWNEPKASPVRPAEFSSTTSSRGGDLFVPRSNLRQLFDSPLTFMAQMTQEAIPADDVPRRLGSPFSAAPTSLSFPTRLLRPRGHDCGSADRVTGGTHEASGSTAAAARSSLPSRWFYMDQRVDDPSAPYYQLQRARSRF